MSGAPEGGEPLAPAVRQAAEASFGVDLGAVRVHADTRAGKAAEGLSARAFTYGNHIFLGRREQATDVRLLAHELAHVVQQQSAPAVQRSAPGQGGPHEREADHASQAAASGASFRVNERTQGPGVQRLGLGDVLDFIAGRANNIPGFRMFTIVLGVNPINMSRVDRSAANILRAVVEFMPGGGLITRALDTHGVFERAGTWVEQQIQSLGMTGSVFRAAVSRFIDSLGLRDFLNPGGVWERARRIFTEPIDRIISTARAMVSGIVQLVKDAILRPLARLAEGTRGYDLLKAVLGRDPITGEAVPRNAETLIGGFMKLIGQEEIWNNLKRANAVSRAWAWFQGALGGLTGFVRQVPGLFLSALRSLEIADIVLLPRAFARVASAFGGFIGGFLSWAGNTVWNLLEIIFSVVAPGVMPYLRRAAETFRTILRNPMGFVGNLVRAGLQGLRQFAARFLTHLRGSLIGWLTGAMSGAGIYIPQGFNLQEILKFVLSVLGLTWQNIRQKLVRAVGETAVRAMETAFDIVRTLVTQGPAAAWEQIQQSLSNLREMVMEQVMTFVRDRVVQAAITRLVTSLNPAGAFIQAIIATYNTVMFFVERMRQIAQVAASVIDSLAAIASGAIGPAANRVEQTMAGLLTLVISFLARIAGLGRVSDAVTNVVNRVRQPIDRALDRVVDWIVAQARRLGRFIASTVRGTDTRTPEEKQRDLDRAVRELRPRIAPLLRRGIPRSLLAVRLAVWQRQYRLTSLSVVGQRLVAAINPTAPMYNFREVLIGRELEVRLVAARTRFLRELGSASPSSSRFAQQLGEAEAAVRSGQTAPTALSPEQFNLLGDRIRSGAVTLQPPPLARGQRVQRQQLFDPTVQGYSTEVRIPAGGGPPRGQNFLVPTLGAYAAGHLPGQPAPIPNDPNYDPHTSFNYMPPYGLQSVNRLMESGVETPDIRGLRVLESARTPGGQPALQVTSTLHQAGVLSASDITYGRPAGMATGGSAVQGEAAFRRFQRGQPSLANAATRVRQGSYAVAFDTLLQALRQDQTRLLVVTGGDALVQVGGAFERWLMTAVRGMDVQDTAQARAAGEQLTEQLHRFLQATSSTP
ncbi:eCIS core domain-containing protein [Pyxidicoccus trucidator]|uniref:eCIS core domain-containing protein n=1 Tax=Pyxidicoccus trucidator TaxID=2709662 RepID=UPI00196836CF|nr:DUF4157 domain-containing protein [Pyxidicoccus trucidator]